MKSNGDTISLKYYIVTLYQILINVLRWSAEASLHHIDKYWTKVFQQPRCPHNSPIIPILLLYNNLRSFA
jgi:hypothetical protein